MAERNLHNISDDERQRIVDTLISRGNESLKREDYKKALHYFREASVYAPLRKDLRELVGYALDCLNEIEQPIDPPRIEKPDYSDYKESKSDSRTTRSNKTIFDPDIEDRHFRLKNREEEVEEDQDEEEDYQDIYKPEPKRESAIRRSPIYKSSTYEDDEEDGPKKSSKFWVFFLVFSFILFAVVLGVIIIAYNSKNIVKITQKITGQQEEINTKVNALIEEATVLSNDYQKRYDEAVGKLKEAQQLNPPTETLTVIDSKIAQVYYDQGSDKFEEKKYEEARKSYEEAVKLNPIPDYYYSLGWAYYFLANDSMKKNSKNTADSYYALAEEKFMKTIELDNNFAKAYNGLGQIYIKTNQTQKAIEAFKKIIELDPESDVAERARKTLKSIQ